MMSTRVVRMKENYITSIAVFFALAVAVSASVIPSSQSPQRKVPPPVADHHQHLFSSETSRVSGFEPLDAADLIAYLDAAGIQRATVLSVAYQFGNPNRPPVENEYT